MQDLSLEITPVYEIEVDDAERPHTCRREVQGCGRTKAARPHHEDAPALQFRLACETNVGKREVPRVPQQLLMRQRGQLPDATPAI